MPIRYHHNLRTTITTLAVLLCSPLFSQAQRLLVPGSVPFVGCPSDGQTGPQDAPTEKNKLLNIPVEGTQQLAYYAATNSIGVLAPRGWHCFGTYGSSGDTLYVSPEPLDAKQLFSDTWHGFTGPAIQLSSISGDTSGRFTVASVIARVFPAYRAFVKKVKAEGAGGNFPSGPYPNDKLIHKGKRVIEYTTPPQADGLGTASRLQKNDGPIRGVAVLTGDTPDLVMLSVRLPPALRTLTPYIVQQVEREAARPAAPAVPR